MGAYSQLGGAGDSVPLGALTPSSSSVSSSSTVVVAANPARKSLVVINTGEDDVYFGNGSPASVGSGLVLTPTGTWVMDKYTYTLDAIHAVCSSSSSISIQEYN